MDAHERSGHTGKDRVSPRTQQLYDRIATLLRRLLSDRRATFAEYVDEQAQSNDGRPFAEEDRGKQ
jgi:hypothetical protein